MTVALSEKDDKSEYAGSGHFITWQDGSTGLESVLTVSMLLISRVSLYVW